MKRRKERASPSPLFHWKILLSSQVVVIFKPVVNSNEKWKDLKERSSSFHARALNMTHAGVERVPGCMGEWIDSSVAV